MPNVPNRGKVAFCSLMPDFPAMKAILTGILLLACVGCAEPMFSTRAVQDEPSLLVGLASYTDSEKLAMVRHNHPVDWSETDLRAILARLLVQERGGIMDPTKPPEEVFSPEEISHLVPPLREAFKVAGPSEWIVFALWSSSKESQALEVTSGGMFLQAQRLHIILANHRERVSSEQEGITGIHRNPFRSLQDIKKGTLTFDPIRYVIDSRDNWIAGGYQSPASELVLDLKRLLAMDRFSPLAAPEKLTGSESSAPGPTLTPSSKSELGALREEISNLKEELSRLQHLIIQQDAEPAQPKSPQQRPPAP